MKRVNELLDSIAAKFPDDDFLPRVRNTLSVSALAVSRCREYECAFSCLDPQSWATLLAKGIEHYRQHRLHNWMQGLFDQLNEAFAYEFLYRRGYSEIRFLPEEGSSKMPDLEFWDAGVRRHCEVKTANLSQVEIEGRQRIRVSSGDDSVLPVGFFGKLCSHIAAARKQLDAHGDNGLVFIVANFDSLGAWAVRREYEDQIHTFVQQQNIELAVKLNLPGVDGCTYICHAPLA